MLYTVGVLLAGISGQQHHCLVIMRNVTSNGANNTKKNEKIINAANRKWNQFHKILERSSILACLLQDFGRV